MEDKIEKMLENNEMLENAEMLHKAVEKEELNCGLNNKNG